MAIRYTQFLRLRIDDRLSADAKYNLERIDALAATFVVDRTLNLGIRSSEDVTIEPESAEAGFSGTGSTGDGVVNIGTSSHTIAALNLYAQAVNFLGGSLGLLDTAAGGTRKLQLKYKSDVSGSTDTGADRALQIDLEGADRNIILTGNLVLGGALTTAADMSVVGAFPLTVNVAALSNITLPSGTRTLVARDTTDILTNKSLSALTNTVTDIADASVSATAAIQGTKIAPDFGAQVVQSTGRLQTSDALRLLGPSYWAALQAASSGQAADFTLSLPTGIGVAGQFLRSDGVGGTTWSNSPENTHQENWLAADGTTKVVTHGLNTSDVDVTIIDQDTGELQFIDSAIVTDPDTLTLSSAIPPVTAWRVLVEGFVPGAGGFFAGDWLAADGAVKTVTHNLNTTDVDVTVIDQSTGEILLVDVVDVQTVNVIQLTASSAPAVAYRVIVKPVS